MNVADEKTPRSWPSKGGSASRLHVETITRSFHRAIHGVDRSLTFAVCKEVVMRAALCLIGVGGLVAGAASCGSVTADNDAGNGDGGGDGSLMLAASPSSFLLHARDTRDTLLTITNPTNRASGTPLVEVTGLSLGTMTFNASTCTSDLAPGASCTVVGHLTATAAGQISFQVTASATSVGSAMTTLPMTVMAACPGNCGPNTNANCCASSVVPGNAVGATAAGDLYYRSYDVATDGAYPNQSAPATVSDFRFDTYEITVGRFRAFVNANMGTQQNPPAAAAGAHEKIPGSGWDASWNANLAPDTATLTANVKCNATYQSWTDTTGANEGLPMNCLSWYEAFAFCAWDGGYLPSEAEWNYAASGGSEHRAYPWSNPASSTSIDCTYANYKPSATYCVNGTTGAVNRVGSESAKGDGKWGHSDLGGNVFEWNLDWFASSYTTPCNDCANLTAASDRVVRGGAFTVFVLPLRAAYRTTHLTPNSRFGDLGVRCARLP